MFSILKYGAKIFLAVMGFISFDDINEKQVNFNPDPGLNDSNYIPFVIPNSSKTANNIFYADEVYFPLYEEPINYMICREINVPTIINKHRFEGIDERNLNISSKLPICMNESLLKFEVIIIDPTEKHSADKFIKVLSVKENYFSRTRITNSEIIVSDLTN